LVIADSRSNLHEVLGHLLTILSSNVLSHFSDHSQVLNSVRAKLFLKFKHFVGIVFKFPAGASGNFIGIERDQIVVLVSKDTSPRVPNTCASSSAILCSIGTHKFADLLDLPLRRRFSRIDDIFVPGGKGPSPVLEFIGLILWVSYAFIQVHVISQLNDLLLDLQHDLLGRELTFLDNGLDNTGEF
jgi:hypothetical protein